MDFLSKNKTVVGIAALASLFGAAVQICGENVGKEPVVSEVFYEADLQTLRQDYANKIQSLKTEIKEGGVSQEKLNEVAAQIASYLEEWVRQAEREDLMKAAETARTQPFPIYVEMILMWLKDDQSNANQLQQERAKLFAGFSPEQTQQILQKIQQIQRSRVDDYHRRLAVLSLTTRAEILKTQGKQLAEQLVEICSPWDESDRAYLPSILNLLLTQRACDLQPALADHHLQLAEAYDLFSSQLQPELQLFNQTLSTLFEALSPLLPAGRSIETE